MRGHDSDGSVALPILLALAVIVGIGVYHTYIAPLMDPKPAHAETTHLDR